MPFAPELKVCSMDLKTTLTLSLLLLFHFQIIQIGHLWIFPEHFYAIEIILL